MSIMTELTDAAKINMSPPMVGVPDFLLCQEGPSSRISCPNFSLIKRGRMSGAAMALTANAIIAANK